MVQDWASAACRWLDEFGWSELERDGFTQVDIDWFSNDAPSRPVPAALDVVRAALELVQQRMSGMNGLVTVPLPYAKGLDADAPSLPEVLDADWDYGPGREVVGLYVLDPEQLEAADEVEEVRVP